MSLTYILLTWALVSVLFLLWEVVTVRLSHAGNAGGWLRAPARIYIAEALVLTLLGTLWFASIGSGTWPLVFLLLGVLMEWPGPVRHGIHSPDGSRLAARRIMLGVLRVMAAGAVMWVTVG
jgi:hypothetical protein